MDYSDHLSLSLLNFHIIDNYASYFLLLLYFYLSTHLGQISQPAPSKMERDKNGMVTKMNEFTMD